MGIDCADEFSYRLPSPQALETFLSTFFEYQVLDSGAIQHNPTPDVPARTHWLQGAAAASLRRLHEVSKALSTKELHKIIDEPLQGEAPRKLTPAVIAELEQQAHGQGLPPMDTETRPGSTYIPWEVYTSEEIEGRARRQGLGGRDLGFKVIPSDSGLR
eukprot:6478254-Amphidinium_carterae.1